MTTMPAPSPEAAILPGSNNFIAKYVNGDVGPSAVYETPTALVPSGAVAVGTTAPFDVLHLRFANGDGLVEATVLEAVPAAKSTRQARIPSVWDPAEVRKVLQAVDRGNPCGKRDYAIILLITRLGLRGVDVKRLRFADLDWPSNRVSVVQAKTGRRIQLPLLKDVGWAIIDYIRHGRPETACPKVFVKHRHPFDTFGCASSVASRLSRHAARTGIEFPPEIGRAHV